MRIDPHVHCRDEGLSHKSTIAQVLDLATEQGVDIIFDISNNKPVTKDRTTATNRRKLVPPGQEWRYFIWLGLTKDPEQREEAVWCYNNFPWVIGLMWYACSGMGELSITNLDDERAAFTDLRKRNYTGPIKRHSEKDSLMHPKLWDPTQPITHCYARPKEAEIESVGEGIQLVKETQFQGTLHIPHISCPESVHLVNQARREMKITCGVTPHGIMWYSSMMNLEDGLKYKVNSPLRDHETVMDLRHCLIRGDIDWIETDHAPHTDQEKFGPPYASGIPSLKYYRFFVEEFLPSLGLTPEQIQDLTYNNIVRVFGEKLRLAGLKV